MTGETASVLIVDDDPAIGTVLGGLLRQAGFGPLTARSGKDALDLLERTHVDVVVSDVRMPGMNGMTLLAEIGRRWPDVPVVMLTAHGSVSLAVEAMKAGAADFLLKPFDREQILFVIRKVWTASRAAAESVPTSPPTGDFVGDSPAMQEVYRLIRRAAPGSATVLIHGETGTGKDLAARAIHAKSPRKSNPFVKVHCAGLPDTLLESELFGYERGAFTGATARKPGRVELAARGTLFLDEVGDITPAMQVKLLRVLQDRQYERLGGTRTLDADVRFVAATHRALDDMVEAGTFREDLFYRLNVIPIWIPPLRERPEDIEPLARHFCNALGAANGKPDAELDGDAIALLGQQPWPGNVRQLQNFVERLVVLSDGSTIRRSDVERELSRHLGRPRPDSREPAPSAPEAGAGGTLDARRRQAERQALEATLTRCRNNRTQAARILGISRRTLYNKLQELGLA